MPKTVEFPELGSVDFPDEMSWEDVRGAVAANHADITAGLKAARIQQMEAETIKADPPTIADKYVQTIRSIGKGAIRGAAAIPKLIGELSAGVNRRVYDGGEPGTVRSGDPRDLLTYQFGSGIESAAEAASPDVPGLEGSFLYSDVPSGIGQVGGALATGGAVRGAVQGGLGALGVKAASKIGSDVAVTTTLSQMAAAEFDDAYQRSVERGDTPDLAVSKASAYAVIATAVESKLGIGRLAKRFGLEEPTKEAVERVAKEGAAKVALKELTAGFTEEAIQRAAQDFIVEGSLDVNAIVREGGAGGLVQALLGGLAHSRRRAAAQQTLDWISERQANGMTAEEARQAGLQLETLQELGIPVRMTNVEEGKDFNLPSPDPAQSAPAEAAVVAPAPATPPQDSVITPDIPRLDVEGARKHVESLLGAKLPAYLDIYSTPGETAPSGGLVRGVNLGGRVRLNVGNIKTVDELEAVLLHEGFHNVEQFPDVREAMEGLRSTVTAAQVQEAMQRGYSQQEAELESVARLLEQEHLDGKQRSAWRKLWAAVRMALQKSFGWAGVRFEDVDARRILASSLRQLRADAASGVPRFSMAGETVEHALGRTAPMEAPDLGLPPLQTNAGKRALGDWFKPRYGTVIEAADGVKVRIQNPRYKDWIRFLAHLVSENKTGAFNPNKAEWLPLLQHSLENAQMRAVDPANGDRLYITTYAGPKTAAHVVVVSPEGNLKEFRAGSLATLQTQFAAHGPNKRWGLPVEWVNGKAGSSVGQGSLPRPDPASSSPGSPAGGQQSQDGISDAGGQPRYSLGDRPDSEPVRQHTEQLNASVDIDDTVKERIANYLYERRNNKDDAAFASELVSSIGVDRAEALFRDSALAMPEAVRTMLGHAIIKAWGQLERQARVERRLDQANRIADRAAAFINNDVLPRSTEIAQALQAFSVFAYLTPSGWIATAKRVIDTARGNVMAGMVEPVKQIAAGLRVVSESALVQLPNAADVQSATIEAVNRTIEEDPEVNREVRKEASKAFGNLAGIVLTHFSGQSREALAARLKAELQLSDEEAGRMAKRVERKWVLEVERYKRELGRRTDQQRTLWQRYQDSIASAVAAQVKMQLATPGRKGALDVFSRRVATALGAQVRAALPNRPANAPELTDIQIIGEALKNPEKYREAWSRVVEVLQAQFADQPGVLAQLDQVLAQDPELVSESRLDSAIASKLKQLRAKIGETVKRHFLEQAATSRRLSDSLVNEAGVQGAAALELADRITKRFAKLAEGQRRRLLDRMARQPDTARVAKRKKTAERLIELANLGGFSDDAALEVVSDSLGLPSLTAEAKAEIVKRADALQQMPEGSHQRGQATVAMMNLIARQKGLSWWELPLAFWYANTLSGPLTHAVNAASNLLSLGGNVSAVLAHNPTAVGVASKAIYRGFVQGGREARAVLATGVSKAVAAKMEAQGPLELLEDQDLKGAGRLLKYWRYVARMLAATDQLFYAPAKEVKAAVLARGLAKREGLTGARLAARVREILGEDSEGRHEAQAQAMSEGLEGLEYARRVSQLMEARRPESLREDAHEFALLTTFNNAPYGLLGAIAEGFNTIHRKTVVTRLIVPFVNVVANVTNETLNFSPVGFGRAAWAHWNVRTQGSGRLHGRDITSMDTVHDAYAKASLGLLGTGALLALAAAGAGDDDYWFQINGAGPATPDQRKGLRATGWIPHSLRIGKRYWSYANTPLAVPMAIVGNYLDAVKYRKLGDTDLLNRVAFAVATSGSVVVQQSYLDSVAQLLGSLDHISARSADHRAVDVVSRAVTTVAVPQALRQIDRIFDPTVTEPSTVAERVVAQIPFARRNLKPALNALGQPVALSPTSRFTSRDKGDELWAILAAKRAWPTVPDQGLLTPEEHYGLVELRGTLLQSSLAGALPRIAAARPDEAKRLVADLSGAATARAKTTLGLDRVERLRKLEAP